MKVHKLKYYNFFIIFFKIRKMNNIDPTSNPDGTVKLDENGNPILDGPPSVINEEVM